VQMLTNHLVERGILEETATRINAIAGKEKEDDDELQ
jgi:hypothetical protein